MEMDNSPARFLGSVDADTVVIGAQARIRSINGYDPWFGLDAGDDVITISSPGSYSVRLDAGADTVNVTAPDVILNLPDFDAEEDVLNNH